MKPGIHAIEAASYHADPCPEPSLSSGVARLMLRSPMHARHAHPRLNPNHEQRKTTDAMVKGTVFHKLLLGEGAEIEVLDFGDYKTKAAQEAKSAAYANGKTPMLRHVFDDVHDGAMEALSQMKTRADCAQFFAEGRSEAALIWREGDAWCRAMVDRLPSDARAPLFDLKATGGSAAPDEWQKNLIKTYAFQAAFYLRGARALGLRPPEMRFVVIECDAPNAVSVQAAGPSLMALADAQVNRAIEAWKRCMATGAWPGYADMTAYVDAPPWMLAQMQDQMLNDEILEEYAA